MATTNIYILRLEGGRYYIGKSDNIMERYQQHLNGNGAAWTRKHKPLSLVKAIEKVSPFEEDKITKEYMSKYGIDKVRGGSYVEVQLNEIQRNALNMEIWAANDRCTRCGRTGHFIKNCYASTDISGNILSNKSESKRYSDDDSDDESDDDSDDDSDDYSDDDSEDDSEDDYCGDDSEYEY